MPQKQFGSEVGSLKKLKAQLKRGGNRAITYIPKEGITVRFLQEPMTFWKYEECWDDKTKKSFPYADGMVEGVDFTRKSTTFLANAVNVEDTDKVIVLQVKASVLNRLVIKFEKYGTIMDRDYEISKYGSGKQTEYDVEPEEKMKRNLSKYELLDLADACRQAYEAVFGGDDDEDDDEDEDKPRPGPRRKQRRGFSEEADDEDEDDEDDDDEDDEPVRRKKVVKKKRTTDDEPVRRKKVTPSKKRRK